MENSKKKRVVFSFVEAGLGHIMPMRAVSDAFEKKYGDKVEVIKTYFFQDKKDPNMKFVEEELINEVKKHNKNRFNGFIQFFGLRLFGSRLSMKYLMNRRYKRGYQASLDYVKELDADLYFNTHFSTLHYTVYARNLKMIKPTAKIVSFCPDPVVGLQWDNRGDMIALSSATGKNSAIRSRRFNNDNIVDVPFLIRKEVKDFDKGRQYYREQLGIPLDQFTILAADGAYGAGRLKQTVYELLKSKQKLTIIAVCGKNEQLYQEFLKLTVPDNITFRPYGFTDKMLTFSAACDLFIGKAGASNLAEPSYFGVPSIVTFLATPIEKWICRHYVESGCTLKITNVEKAVATALEWANNPALMEKFAAAARAQARCDGPDILADILWQQLNR